MKLTWTYVQLIKGKETNATQKGTGEVRQMSQKIVANLD